MKQYLLTIEQPDGPPPAPAIMTEVVRRLDRLNSDLVAEGGWVFSGGLHPPSTATVVRAGDTGVLYADGPYTEGKEHVGEPQLSIAALFRAEYGRAVAVLVRLLGDIDLAEEAVQDAFIEVIRRWPDGGSTDWRAILALYDQMMEVQPTPLVALHRAVAVSEVAGPILALQLVDALDLRRQHIFHAVRADLPRRLGRPGDPVDAYREALVLTDNVAEKRFLEGRTLDLVEQTGPRGGTVSG